jgi:hypothetical protein
MAALRLYLLAEEVAPMTYSDLHRIMVAFWILAAVLAVLGLHQLGEAPGVAAAF